MKNIKIILASSVLFLGACSMLNGTSSSSTTTSSTTADSSTVAKLKSCTLEEAVARVKDGTVFQKNLTETADDISNSCLQKLALESAGLDTEAKQSAFTSLTDAIKTYSNN